MMNKYILYLLFLFYFSSARFLILLGCNYNLIMSDIKLGSLNTNGAIVEGSQFSLQGALHPSPVRSMRSSQDTC